MGGAAACSAGVGVIEEQRNGGAYQNSTVHEILPLYTMQLSAFSLTTKTKLTLAK